MEMYCLTVQEGLSPKSRWFPLKPAGKSFFGYHLLLVVCRQSLAFIGLQMHKSNPLSSQDILCFPVFTRPSSYKDTNHIALGVQSTPITSSAQLITSAMALFPHKSHLEVLGVGTSSLGRGRGHTSIHSRHVLI